MSGNRRKAFFVSAVLVGGSLLVTACQGAEAAGGGSGAAGAAAAPSAAASAPAPAAPAPAAAGKAVPVAGGTGKGSGADAGKGGRGPVGQVCGAGDLSWSTRSESQAGGYILISAKAKPGITCVLPAALPTVAFGSDGTQAGPAEQAVGKQITLSGSTTAYAGLNPKSTSANGGREFDFVIVAVGDDDPAPVSLKVGAIVVDKPVVTNWHTSAKDAVPLG
ncbi:hypothetical protein ACGFXC_34570 [Streptomyces sp. NPDC048507]|uniref:hypothetical protein n=1 Tax=Streptomyces sp. NPDC048507 TaxID=3365560 RepID=UPI003713E0D6